VTEQPLVTVVVVSYNGDDWLDRCLGALLVDARPRVPFEVVVVDNGSDAPTRAVLARWSTQVRVHYSAENLGFGRACNLAVSLSEAPRIVLLNPDAVVRPECIDALIDALDRNPGAGIVGGRTIRPDGTLEPSSCWGRPTLWSLFCFATGLSTALRGSTVFDPESLGGWERDTERRVDIVTGCLLATDRTTWDRLGGFDERFFMYGEDADLSLRARKMGFQPRITPHAVAVHAVGASSDRKAHKNRLLMTGKATLARTLWSGPGSRVALALLTIGVLVRATGETLLRSRNPAWRPLMADLGWTRGWSGVTRTP